MPESEEPLFYYVLSPSHERFEAWIREGGTDPDHVRRIMKPEQLMGLGPPFRIVELPGWGLGDPVKYNEFRHRIMVLQAQYPDQFPE